MTNPEGVAKARERVGRAPARERCSGVSFPVGSSFRRLVVPDSTNVYRLRPAFVPPSSRLRPAFVLSLFFSVRPKPLPVIFPSLGDDGDRAFLAGKKLTGACRRRGVATNFPRTAYRRDRAAWTSHDLGAQVRYSRVGNTAWSIKLGKMLRWKATKTLKLK